MTDQQYLADFEATLDRKLSKDRGSYKGFSSLERLAALREWFQREVNNGGLETYFYNSAGMHAVETVSMLRTIGAAEAGDILARAIKLFGSCGPSTETRARRKQLESMTEDQQRELSGLTAEYFVAEERGLATYDLLQKYLLKQRQSTAR